MSVLPFVYFRQTQCKEIVEVILLSNQKDKMRGENKKTQQKRPKVQQVCTLLFCAILIF